MSWPRTPRICPAIFPQLRQSPGKIGEFRLLGPAMVASLGRLGHRDGPLRRPAAALPMPARLRREILVLHLEAVQLSLRQLLQVQELAARPVRGLDDLIELDVQRLGVARLRVLDEEHHEERHDGGPRVDHELPGVAEPEEGARDGPHDDGPQGEEEGAGVAAAPRHPAREAAEGRVLVLDDALVPPRLLVHATSWISRGLARFLAWARAARIQRSSQITP